MGEAVRHEAGCLVLQTLLHFRPPTEFIEQRILFLLNRIGDEISQKGRELESVPAVPGRDDQAGPLRVSRDPEISIVRVALKTNPGMHNRRRGQRREGFGQKFAQTPFVVLRHDTLG